MGENRSMLRALVTWTVVGILAIVAFRLAVRLLGFVMGLFGIVLGMFAFLLFTLGPIVLVGWLTVKAWKAFTREPAL